MIVYRGYGWVVILFAVLVGYAALQSGDLSRLTLVAGLFVFGILCIQAGGWLNNPKRDRQTVDENTGDTYIVKRRSNLFFIPVQYYGWAAIATIVYMLTLGEGKEETRRQVAAFFGKVEASTTQQGVDNGAILSCKHYISTPVDQVDPAKLIPTCLSAQKAAPADQVINYQLARLYQGNKQDALARSWYGRTASNGFTQGMYQYATMLRNGAGGPVDLMQARAWMSKAAENGYTPGMSDYALMLANGEGGPANLAESRSWYLKAANNRDVTANYNLGVMNEQGMGGDPDLSEARRFYRAALSLGDKTAQTALDRVEAAMQKPTHPVADTGPDNQKAAELPSDENILEHLIIVKKGKIVRDVDTNNFFDVALSIYSDYVEVISKTNSIVIKKITINRGNCSVSPVNFTPLPQRLGFGGSYRIAEACEAIEVLVETDQGTATYNWSE